MALVSQSDFEARLGRSLTAEEASAFTVINAALQAHVERLIGSSVESVSATTRYYDGGVQHLSIDPCTNITAIDAVDDDQVSTYTYDTSDYTAEPINRTLKNWVRHRSGKLFRGINNIRVTAKFSIYGDEGLRNIVKNAILEGLSSEIENTDNVLKESIEGYSVEYATTETKNALSGLKYLFPGV